MRWSDKNIHTKKAKMTPDEDAMYNELHRLYYEGKSRPITYTEMSEACTSCNLTYERGMMAMMGLAMKGYFAVRRIK